MKKTIKLTFALMLGLSMTFVSCDKDDDPVLDPHEDAFGDVFIKKVKSQNGDKYGYVFYAGGQGLTSCTATVPDGTVYTLAEFWKGAGNMRLHPKDNEMKLTKPALGEFVFSLTFDDGQTITITDELTDVEIPSITGIKVEHTEGTNAVKVTWNKVDGVDNYMVKLTDKDKNENKPLFNIKTLTATDTEYSFDQSTSASPGWMGGVPTAGETCYVMVVGIKYEEGISGSEKDQNKQMNTTKPTMIIW
jgi:DUF971 family protein